MSDEPRLPTLRRRNPAARQDDEDKPPRIDLDERVSLRTLDDVGNVLEATAHAFAHGRIDDKGVRALSALCDIALKLEQTRHARSAPAQVADQNGGRPALTHEEAARGPYAFGVFDGGKR